MIFVNRCYNMSNLHNFQENLTDVIVTSRETNQTRKQTINGDKESMLL